MLGRLIGAALSAMPPPACQFVSLRAFRPPRALPAYPWTAGRRPASGGRSGQRQRSGGEQGFTLPAAPAPASALAARAGGPPVVPAADRLDGLFGGTGPVLLLERSVGERVAADAPLWTTGAFQVRLPCHSARCVHSATSGGRTREKVGSNKHSCSAAACPPIGGCRGRCTQTCPLQPPGGTSCSACLTSRA